MNFGERYGFEPKKTIQIDTMDSTLRNRLYNCFSEFCPMEGSQLDWQCLRYIMDKLGYARQNLNYDKEVLQERLLNKTKNSMWYDIYNVIEYFIEIRKIQFNCSKIKNCKRCKNFNQNHFWYDYDVDCKNFVFELENKINKILEEENSGYRLVNNQFSRITNNNEISSIESAINFIEIPGKHIEKALALYSDKENPDYENSIKESISAVESMCCIICGQDGKGATLGKSLNKLEENGVKIHTALKGAFQQMYGYTSDTDGIRHGGIDFANAPAEDAKYMLVTCSAFVNYLKEKYIKIGANQQ